MSEKPKNKPVERLRIGGIHASIWRNASREGKIYYSYKVEKRYRDDADQWQSSDSYMLGDALVTAKLANLVDTKIRQLMAADAATANAAAELADAV